MSVKRSAWREVQYLEFYAVVDERREGRVPTWQLAVIGFSGPVLIAMSPRALSNPAASALSQL